MDIKIIGVVMNNADNVILSTVIIIIVVFAVNLGISSKYQVANFGERGAIVLDQQTGEAWVTDGYEVGKETIYYLKPVGYCDSQKPTYKYKPDEQRNDKNTNWLTWFQRKVGSINNQRL